MDPILFVLTVLATLVAGAALLLPSDASRVRWAWDDEELRNQLEAGG